MATSDSRDFDLDVGEIVEEAYERCGLEVRTGYDARTARRSLNIMFSEWANRGLNLWTVNSATQALTEGTSSYTFTAEYTDLLEVVLRRSGTDFSMSKISRGEYLNLPIKTQKGRPTQYYFDRQITPKIFLWPTPENSTDTFVYDALTRIQDADTAKNTMEVPFRFYPCLTAGLAYYLAMKKAPDRIQILKAVYEEEFERASAEDRDRSNLTLTPSSTYYGFV